MNSALIVDLESSVGYLDFSRCCRHKVVDGVVGGNVILCETCGDHGRVFTDPRGLGASICDGAWGFGIGSTPITQRHPCSMPVFDGVPGPPSWASAHARNSTSHGCNATPGASSGSKHGLDRSTRVYCVHSGNSALRNSQNEIGSTKVVETKALLCMSIKGVNEIVHLAWTDSAIC